MRAVLWQKIGTHFDGLSHCLLDFDLLQTRDEAVTHEHFQSREVSLAVGVLDLARTDVPEILRPRQIAALSGLFNPSFPNRVLPIAGGVLRRVGRSLQPLDVGLLGVLAVSSRFLGKRLLGSILELAVVAMSSLDRRQILLKKRLARLIDDCLTGFAALDSALEVDVLDKPTGRPGGLPHGTASRLGRLAHRSRSRGNLRLADSPAHALNADVLKHELG